jgi:hypothetical protein
MLQAAGRHQCSYLINLQKQEFLLQGGDHTWLKGLSRIPQKLRDLYEINKILAHRPWLLNKSHIEVHTVICWIQSETDCDKVVKYPMCFTVPWIIKE